MYVYIYILYNNILNIHTVDRFGTKKSVFWNKKCTPQLWFMVGVFFQVLGPRRTVRITRMLNEELRSSKGMKGPGPQRFFSSKLFKN